MIRIGLLINKQQLDTNMEVIRTKLREKVDIINQLVVDFSTYGKQESTSQALEVLKGYANNEIPNMLNRLSDVFNTIIDKTYKIQDRYEQLCGNCSLNEVDLENNIEILDKILKRTEETKYQLLKVEIISTEQINQQIEDIKELKMLYQDKLDGLLEFDRFSTDIFYDESQEIVRITKDLRSLSSNLESPFISTGLFFDRTNIVLDKLQNENQENKFNISTPEQEQILGITYDEFEKLYSEQYGFTKDEIFILWKIKYRIRMVYKNPEEAEQVFSELIGMMRYHKGISGIGWKKVLGNKFSSEKKIKEFLTETIGLFDEEANLIYESVNKQNDEEGKNGFAHSRITMATILKDNENTFILDRYRDGFDDEAGWYGDAFGIIDKPSLNNNDYKSDLDTVNILEFKKELEHNGENVTFDQATNIYYERLSTGQLNRATYFKKVRPDVLEHIYNTSFNNYIDKISPKTAEARAIFETNVVPEEREKFDALPPEKKLEHLDYESQRKFAMSLIKDNNELI